MAKRTVIWSLRAINDKLEIYQYWIERNHSTRYAEKLDDLFNEVLELTSLFPKAGIQTEIKSVRFRTVREYKLIYRVSDDSIEVITVWDNRRNFNDLDIKE